jgi:cysteinyl-tRNA synthetase
MHAEFLLMNQAKMAKSEGGFITVKALKDKGFDPLDYRYHCLTAHYRKQLDFSWESLEAAKTARRRLKDAAVALAGPASPACAEHVAAFKEALADDLNVPAALGSVYEALSSDVPSGAKRALLELAESVLAIGLFTATKEEPLSEEVQALLAQRAEARKKKDFAASDRLRREIEARGLIVEDFKDSRQVVRRQ